MIRGSSSWSIFAWVVSFTTLSTIAVLLRFWSARIQRRKFYIDDAFVIVAYVAMFAQQGLSIYALENGMGHHTLDMSMQELLNQAKVLFGVSITWIFCTTTIKLAVLSLYMRIFTTASFKRWAMSLMAIDVCFGIAFLVVFITQCNPVSQQWAPVAGGSCRPLNTGEYASISLNLALDTIIVILPMPWLWKLQMPLSNKIVVMVMFSFGIATIAIMAYRIDLTVNANPDPMIAVAQIGLLSNMELWLGIIVACLPTLAPFIRMYVQPSFSKLSRKLYGSTSPSTKETPRVQLRTFGGSGGPASKGHSNYSELSERSIYADHESDKLHLVANESAKVYTDCEYGNTKPSSKGNGIHVQRQFQSQTLDV